MPRIIDVVTNEVREQSRLSVGSYRYKNPTLGLPKSLLVSLGGPYQEESTQVAYLAPPGEVK